METNEEKILKLEFYQELLLSVTNTAYPFYSLIINNKLSKKEVEEIFYLCKHLNNEYEKQKEEGFVTFFPLLTHFVGMLNYKLDPFQTLGALHDQGIYRDLTNELIKASKQT
ncbi:hypothetical protein BKP45_00895 [Anaerobacillus alkalidiazotrophicus]|uniref:DUF1878 domain-containing protein n=1 Tax=Anaerobacillus alkalidiazotrophicus TaxID=472963 RepID=A0A1S2M9G0_9BACI|nr:DUF1878 family protein [Anaerobacillus alkalidiazotrophicus]OIJ21368.1 hypothetical protein BKP45_00895 [Anaerobacillus alkalidiazotrophicus]